MNLKIAPKKHALPLPSQHLLHLKVFSFLVNLPANQNMAVEKMQLPGWRIEQKYNTKVLISNWSEDRRKFERGSTSIGNSTQRTDFQHYPNQAPDVRIRRDAAMRSEGLPRKFLLTHPGSADKCNLISWYDQQINGRELRESSLPNLRKWDGKKLSFTPEKSDRPLQTCPTNFGLHSRMKEKWQREADRESASVFESTYKHSYNMLPDAFAESSQQKRFGNPRALSSHFHKHNQINNNLHFRGNHSNIAPEHPPVLPEIVK